MRNQAYFIAIGFRFQQSNFQFIAESYNYSLFPFPVLLVKYKILERQQEKETQLRKNQAVYQESYLTVDGSLPAEEPYCELQAEEPG